MNRMVWIILLLVAVVAIGLWYVAIDKPGQEPSANVGVAVGKQVPQFNLQDINGKGVQIGQPGKVTVLNFWTSWCPSCREEMPELQQFATAHRSDVDYWGINIQETADKVSAFVVNNNYTMPVLLDTDGSVAATFQINAIPTTLVIDRTGIIRFRKLGGVTQAELENVLHGL